MVKKNTKYLFYFKIQIFKFLIRIQKKNKKKKAE